MNDLRELERLEPQFWRAPSAHNTQPWLLTYAANRVELSYDPERALPAGDPTQRDLLLSLGAFVEAVLIAASHAGISLEFAPAVEPRGRRVGGFVPAPVPYPTAFTPDDLGRRQTSRLAYTEGRLSPDDLAVAQDELAADAELHEVATRDLVDLAREAGRHLYGSPEIVAELRTWLRLGRRHPHYRLDGLSYECLGLGRYEAAAVSLLLRPGVFPLVRRTRLDRAFSASTTRLLERDGSALVLVAVAGSPEQILTHGQSLHRIWLALAKRGLYTHPLSEILDFPPTERQLASRIGATDGRRLLSVFRAGRSAPPPRSGRMR